MKGYSTRETLTKKSPDPKKCILEIIRIQLKVIIIIAAIENFINFKTYHSFFVFLRLYLKASE